MSNVSARYGFQGVRVGEAPTPGPVECPTGATLPGTDSDVTSDTEPVGNEGPDFHMICTDMGRSSQLWRTEERTPMEEAHVEIWVPSCS